MIAIVKEKKESSFGLKVEAATNEKAFSPMHFLYLDRDLFDSLSIGDQIEITIRKVEAA